MDKSPDAFRTISEVADHLETPAHVLRFWESRFPQIRPVKRAGGRRYYRPSDVALLTGIKRLLHDEGLTIRGVQKILRDHGVRHVAGLSDETIALDDLMPAPVGEVDLPAGEDVEDLDDTLAAPAVEDMAREMMPEPVPEIVPEAGFLAVEDEDDDLPPARVPPAQAVLPLFDTAPAAPSKAATGADRPPQPSRKPTLRDDVTFASLIRALPQDALSSARPAIRDLALRLSALRARMAQRAEGGKL
jgi:DNA-binding transcriptional MerR regulator